jgi:transposase
MNSIRSVDGRREQAIALRRAGKSRREIKEILGVGSNTTLNELLAGEPPPEWTRRPNAKDDLHAKARLLREQGYDFNRIAAELGVSKGTVSAWVHDMPGRIGSATRSAASVQRTESAATGRQNAPPAKRTGRRHVQPQLPRSAP